MLTFFIRRPRFAMVIALLLTAIDGAFAPIAPFADVAMYISAAMTVWSGVDYIQKNFDCIRDM